MQKTSNDNGQKETKFYRGSTLEREKTKIRLRIMFTEVDDLKVYANPLNQSLVQKHHTRR